jgi:hypothetical protein
MCGRRTVGSGGWRRVSGWFGGALYRRESSEGPRLTLVKNLKVFLCEVADSLALGVADDNGYEDLAHGGFYHWKRVWGSRLLRFLCQQRQEH